jgi:hypothetical protein
MSLRPSKSSEHLGDVAGDHGAAAEAAIVLGRREAEVAVRLADSKRQVAQAPLDVGARVEKFAARNPMSLAVAHFIWKTPYSPALPRMWAL